MFDVGEASIDILKLAPTIFLPVLSADDEIPHVMTKKLAFHLVGIKIAAWVDTTKHDVLFVDVAQIPDGDEGAPVIKKHPRIQRPARVFVQHRHRASCLESAHEIIVVPVPIPQVAGIDFWRRLPVRVQGGVHVQNV